MKDNAYFDNAATTWPKPESVYTFMDAFFRSHGVNPGRSGHTLAVEAEQMIVATRRMLAAFFGFTGDADRVVFTQNGTDSLNSALGGLLQPGDHVVASRLDHNAVVRVTNHYERDQRIALTRVEPDAAGYLHVDDIRRAITPRTRVIVLNHASNVIGTVQPLADVAALSRELGLRLVVDSAQTAGVIPIDMSTLGIDVLTFTGHKGLYGPMGIGGLVVADDVALKPVRFGGTGVDSLSSFQPDAYPHRLEAGTLSLPGVAGLHAAQLWFRALGEELGAEVPADADDLQRHRILCRRAVDHVHATEMAHTHRIETCLRQFSAARLHGTPRDDARVAITSFSVDGLPTQQVADMLDADHQVCIRAGLHCAPLVHVDAGTVDGGGTIRVAPGFFTDDDDMQQLLNGLESVLA